ncbi:IS630 transposase-related protein, partial [Roseofilum sp. SBFL]
AAEFGVNINAIWYALKQMKQTRKNNSTLQPKETSTEN